MGLPIDRVRGRAGHDDLDDALVVIFVMPGRAKRDNSFVEFNADAAAHADYHGLSLHGLTALVKMAHEVSGNQVQPLFCPDDCLKLRPFALELLFALNLFTFGHFFK